MVTPSLKISASRLYFLSPVVKNIHQATKPWSGTPHLPDWTFRLGSDNSRHVGRKGGTRSWHGRIVGFWVFQKEILLNLMGPRRSTSKTERAVYWPGMELQWTLETTQLFGERVIPELKQLKPVCPLS